MKKMNYIDDEIHVLSKNIRAGCVLFKRNTKKELKEVIKLLIYAKKLLKDESVDLLLKENLIDKLPSLYIKIKGS